MSRFRARALVLILTIGSTCVFPPPSDSAEFRSGGSPARDSAGPSSTTRLTCFEIRPGDTAARLAERFTGSIQNWRLAWFQIVDPVTATIISKTRYDDIEPGWKVCVASDMLRRGVPQPQYVPVSTTGVVVARANARRGGASLGALDPTIVWWAVPLFVAVSGAGLAWGWKRIDERRERVEILRGFGERFIREFERPLRRNATSPPVRTRVRFAPARLRVDILIAPAGGRTYPNLVDHKRNVEYDIERVMQAVGDASFVNGPVYSQGAWVVIPCRFETGNQQEGVS